VPRIPAGAVESGVVVLLSSRRPDGGSVCDCDHGRSAHDHYRRGSDCSLCRCARFRRPLTRRLLPPGSLAG